MRLFDAVPCGSAVCRADAPPAVAPWRWLVTPLPAAAIQDIEEYIEEQRSRRGNPARGGGPKNRPQRNVKCATGTAPAGSAINKTDI
jgi:hypothetical protein